MQICTNKKNKLLKNSAYGAIDVPLAFALSVLVFAASASVDVGVGVGVEDAFPF
jgi:hypothetical protein